MATGKSGSLTVTMGSYNMGTGYVTIYWREECNYSAGTSQIVVYRATLAHSMWAGTYTVNATVYVNGQSIGGISGSPWYNDTMGAPAEVSGVNLTSPAIVHNFDGSKSITISMTVHGASVSHWYVTDVSNSTTVALTAHTHSYTSAVTKQPTCAATGVRTYTCSCGKSYTETIAATGNHSYMPATCTTPQTCSVCGQTAGSAFGHNWDNGTVITEPTYTTDGVMTYCCIREGCGTTKTEIIQRLGMGKRFVPTVFIQGEEYIPYTYESSTWCLCHSLIYNGTTFEEY